MSPAGARCRLALGLGALAGAVSVLWRADRLRAWAAPYRRRREARAFLIRQLEAFAVALRRPLRHDLTTRAAALTYTSLLGLVPLLATAFAVFQAFGGLRRLRGPVNQWIVERAAAAERQVLADVSLRELATRSG